MIRAIDVTVDSVLSAQRPAFSRTDAAAVAREIFGVDGSAREVDSERDQTFLIDGDRPAVLKISNAAEDPAQLDMEALAAQRVAQVDPHCPLRVPWLVPGTPFGRDDPRRTERRSDATAKPIGRACMTGCPAGRRCAASTLERRGRARLGNDGRAGRTGAARLLGPFGRAA